MSIDYNEKKNNLIENAKTKMAVDWLNMRINCELNFSTSPSYMHSATLFKLDDVSMSLAIKCGVIDVFINSPKAVAEDGNNSKIYINDSRKPGTFIEIPTDTILGWMTETSMHEECE